MAYIKITKKIRENANAVAKKKDKLEKALSKDLRKWDKFVAKNFAKSVKNGSPSFAISDKESKSLEKIYRDNFQKAVDSFLPVSFRIISLINGIQGGNTVISNVRDAIAEDITAFYDDIFRITIASIEETTSKDKEKTMSIAIPMATIDSIVFNKLLVKSSEKILKIKLDARIGNRSITWTTSTTEGIRDIKTKDVSEPIANEVEELVYAIDQDNDDAAERHADNVAVMSTITESETAADAANDALIAARTMIVGGLAGYATKLREQKKGWVDIGDKHVRSTHKNATGQVVNINEPFIVGSSRMMYPGDTSLGAPLSETSHCRCTVYYL